MVRPAVIAILAAGLVLAATAEALTRRVDDHPATASAPAAGDQVGIAHPVYAFDPEDDHALAAHATDIFVGRVVAQTGTVGAPTSAPGHEVPQTQFAVDVLHGIKGQAAGTVTVNQVGGLDKHAKRLMLVQGDELLQPGTTELFVTFYVPERGWYQVVAARHGHLRAHDRAHHQALVGRFARVVAAPPELGGTPLATAKAAR